MEDLPIRVDLVIPAKDMSWTAVRGPGPGGQNVNKVATKVDLRFDIEGTTALSRAVKRRLRASVGARAIDAEGRLIVTSQATRTRERNLEDARQKLQVLIRRALVPRKRRRPTKPSAASKRRRLNAKRQRSETKRGRGRVSND